MLEQINSIAKEYGFFVIGGAIGAIIHRLRNQMTIKRFFASIAISMFVSFCVGVVARDYFQLKESLIYVLCGISGVFSNGILDEIEEFIKYFSEAAKLKFGIIDTPKEDVSHIPENPEQTIKDLNSHLKS